MSELLRADDVTHAYGAHTVLHGACVQAAPGQVVGLIGPNGSGKTTLLRTLYGSLIPDAGAITIDGRPLASLTQRQLARRIAVVAQESSSEMPLTVADTVLLGRTPHLSMFRRHSRSDLEIAAEALERVGCSHLARQDFSVLSGGEKQRVMIARALTQQADHLLMDEPTNHLDIHFQHEVLALVQSLGITTIVVLHDLNLAARYCDRLVLLDHGHVRTTGSPEQVLTAENISSVYRVDVEPVETGDGRLQLLFQRSAAAAPLGWPAPFSSLSTPPHRKEGHAA